MPETLIYIAVMALLLLVIAGTSIAVWVVSSHYEAESFQKLTGKQVSTWDAMWLELRVQEPTSER
jgi:flagellar basal body-associated protein FliL